MYKIVMLPLAKKDLDDIVNYLSQYYETTALRIYDNIVGSIAHLSDFPNMCEEYKTLGSQTYRRMVIGDYLVFYTVAGREVQIYRILHGGKDIQKYIP